MGTAEASMRSVYTGRPPNLSVSMPRGNRVSDPVSTGTPIRIPIWLALQSNTWLSTRNVTSTPLSIHAAKHTVNATVLSARTTWARPGSGMTSDVAEVSFTGCFRQLARGRVLLQAVLGSLMVLRSQFHMTC